MASPLFYFKNLLDGATMTISAEDTDNPKENVQDRDRSTYSKPPSTSDWYWDIDCGTQKTADRIIVLSENCYDETVGLKVIVDAGDNPAFPSPQYLVGGAGSGHAATSADQPFWFEEMLSRTKRYWRIYFDSIDSTDFRVNDIYLTQEVDPGRHPGGSFEYGFEDLGNLVQGRGVRHTQKWGDPRDLLGYKFLGLPQADVATFVQAYKEIVRGAWLPWFLKDEYGTLKHVRFARAISYNHHRGILWNLALQVREELEE